MSGNRVLMEGIGPSAPARFDRDVLAQSGVSHVIVFKGINDLGPVTDDRLRSWPRRRRCPGGA
jgi:hypothetical protein